MKRIEIPKIDVTKYIGEKSFIASAVIDSGKYGHMLKVESAPIKLKDGDTLPEGKQLTASVILGLAHDEDGNICIGVDTKADLWLKAHNINVEKDIPDIVMTGTHIEKLEGKEIIVQKNEKGFLEIA